MPEHFDVLIVGAGHAGANLALGLRQRKFGGSIGIVSDEVGWPYERPPLSKSYLAGSSTPQDLMLRPSGVWESHRVQFLSGRRVVAVLPDKHAVELDEGLRITYGRLVWAAGGRARKLTCEGASLEGIHSIRTQNDVDRVRVDLRAAESLVIIGGGYIGLEAAATLVKMGKRVTLIEAQPRLLTRVSGAPISQFLAEQHSSHGVVLKMQAAVARLEGRGNRVRTVMLADGTELRAELVIVGIGMEPNTEPLAAAGAEISNGVRVDAQCRTCLPDVMAIGDCTSHPSRFSASEWARLESVPNAMDQAAAAARVLMGESIAQDSVPWFWSEQYDTKLQTVGLAQGYDGLALRGEPESGSFSVVYLRGGRIVALDCVNSPRDFVQGKTLVSRGVAADARAIAATAELKTLAS